MCLPAKNGCSYTLDRSLTNTKGLKFNCKAAATWESKLELWLHKESGTPVSWIDENKSWHVPSKGCENMLLSEFFPKLLLLLYFLLVIHKCSVRTEPFTTLWRIYTFHFQNTWNYRMRWEGDYVVWISVNWIWVLLILSSSIWNPGNLFSQSWLLEMDIRQS